MYYSGNLMNTFLLKLDLQNKYANILFHVSSDCDLGSLRLYLAIPSHCPNLSVSHPSPTFVFTLVLDFSG